MGRLFNWFRQHRPLLNWLRQRPLLNWLRQRRPLRRLFRFLFLRRLYSHYWNENGCLTYITWWQWLNYCFCTRSSCYIRLTHSTWGQILNRVEMGDKDACLIHKLILRANQEDCERFYNIVIATISEE